MTKKIKTNDKIENMRVNKGEFTIAMSKSEIKKLVKEEVAKQLSMMSRMGSFIK